MPARDRAFTLPLAAIVGVGLAIRLVYALTLAPDPTFLTDASYFHLLANGIGEGRGFVDPFGLAVSGVEHPTAAHPPLYTLALAGSSVLGGTGMGAHRAVSCLLGAGTVAAVGLLGRRVGGETAGLVAAGLAAAYPLLWVIDGSLMSESLYALTIALALLCALRALERPDVPRLAVLGAVCGLATLTRGEALLLVPLLVVPVAWLGRTASGGGWRPALAAVAAFALVLAPWSVRNWIAFDTPVLVSNNTGTLLAGANCADTYGGALLGGWSVACLSYPPHESETETAARLRRRGLDYVRDRTGRFVVVAGVRVLRTWDLFRPSQQIELSRQEARDTRVQRAGVGMYYVLVPFALAGAWALRRRPRTLYVLLVAPIMVTVMSVAGYGLTRFRTAAEVSIVVLAAVALTALGRRIGARRSARRAAPTGAAS